VSLGRGWPPLKSTQAPAALSPEGRVLIEAPPGSGKTFVAVERFGFLRYKMHINDRRGVAALSFARSAAGELRSRIAHRWGYSTTRGPNHIGTIDDLHRSLLRILLVSEDVQWPGDINEPEVLDSWERSDGAVSLKDEDGKRGLKVAISAGHLVPVERTAADQRPPSRGYKEPVAYLKALASGHCTHDEVRDLVGSALFDAAGPSADHIRAYLARRFAHVIVDEVFDLSATDIAVLDALCAADVGLTLLGDPWQALYGFRGARPDIVEQFAKRQDFIERPITGTERYLTEEMITLVDQLRSGQSFHLHSATPGRRPQVLLSGRWSDLWEYQSLMVIPAGCGGGSQVVDQSTRSSAAFLVLLHSVTIERLETPTGGFVEAVKSLGLDERQRGGVREIARELTSQRSDNEILESLRVVCCPEGEDWEVKSNVKKRLARLRQVLRSGETPILGLSIHQSKGLQWEHVDVLHPATGPISPLQQQRPDDLRLYVALTRAQKSVRVRPPPVQPTWTPRRKTAQAQSATAKGVVARRKGR
jgi:DNA helicase II / ATP-dependent DNA helicase PcrA